MPDSGCSTRAILQRRLLHPTRAGHLPPFETFCGGQLERINRVADKIIRRSRTERQRLATRVVKEAGCELEVHIRGSVGSDAHLEDETGDALRRNGRDTDRLSVPRL